MIQSFVDAYMAGKETLRAEFAKAHPEGYKAIVKAVVALCAGAKEHGGPDPERVHEIDDGDYQGTLVFVIAEKAYQPSDYWYVKVGYGSCSGCDTLQHLRGWEDGPPNDEQIEGYLTLALHVVQGMKKMGEDIA